MQIRGASALVTGGSRGIGRAIALSLAREGAKIAVVARNQQDLDAVVREIQAAGGTGLAVAADVAAPQAAAAIVERTVAAHGGLQILVNNAGVAVHAPLAETSDADWDRILATNVSAPFRLTRAAIPHLTKTGGEVFMISSLAGVNPIAGMSAYCASKAALDHMAACLMLEIRQQGVKVTTICPGSVDTGFGGRSEGDTSWMLRAEDVADVVMSSLHARPTAHSSRIEMRPARPPRRA
jgi:NAD(P)-dependent dehydrogenase (short-subunit alcohol dehydrogenase family)